MLEILEATLPLEPQVAMIIGALWRLNSFIHISPTSPRTFDSTPEIIASKVCSWSQPGLFSNLPSFAYGKSSEHSRIYGETLAYLLDKLKTLSIRLFDHAVLLSTQSRSRNDIVDPERESDVCYQPNQSQQLVITLNRHTATHSATLHTASPTSP